MAPRFLTNLLPPKAKPSATSGRPLLVAIRTVTLVQWALFFSGWLAWTCDAMDFFSVSLSITRLTAQFDKPVHSITTSITLTLLFRSIGAVIFGIISDRYGRKWPLVINMLICCVLELGSGFVTEFKSFLAVRSLFGLAMGGVWGLSSATALENLPVEVRALASGILQQGYAVGYLIAAVVNLTLVPHNKHTWRALFWFSAGLSFLAAVVRAVLPESELFIRAKQARMDAEAGETGPPPNRTKIFLKETRKMLRQHWALCIYAVLLMTGFNFLSHGSQDLYPTFLQDTKGFSSSLATKATIIGNCGAIAGGAIAGWASQYLGRRLTIIIFVLSIGAFIPLWIIPDDFPKLSAGAFCIQFGVQGAWGVIPIALAELSPPAFRATFPGVAYQIGNMISSASAQIEATGGDNLRTTVNGKDVPDYAKVQGILIGVVAAYIVVVTIFGPENHGSEFEKAKVAFEPGAGNDELASGTSVEEDPEFEKRVEVGEKGEKA